MGRLNYTNRKISGTKLGSAVKKDILKHSLAASKSRSAKDPHLEVNLLGKALADDGLAIACDGLRQALSQGSVRLDELNLAENKLTLNGLRILTPIVRLASKDLKDLDLRANEFVIVTQEDADNWEGFLESFGDVSCLRRLDISDNLIGDRGFEILWKVYSRELPIQLPTLLSKSSFSDSSDDEYDTDGMDEDSDGIEAIYRELRGSKESVSSANTTPTKQDADLKRSLYSMTSSQSSAATDLHGLRSIPYLVFSNTGITDSTALFLSYILPIHPTPERLMPHFAPPKTGAQAETMEAYYTLGCRGIVYRTNNSLSNLSNRVLECAEGLREGRPVELLVPEESPFKPPFTPRRRRDSTAYGMPGSSLPELERARSKIQGALLREKGPHCISLWRVALRVLVVSREILFDPNAGPYENHRRTFRRQQGGHMSPMSPTGSAYSPAQLSHHSPLLHPQLHHSPHHSPQLHHSPVQLWKSHSPPRPPVGKFSVLAGNWPVISQYHHHPTSDTVVTPKRRLDCPISFEHLDLKENDPPVATAREDRRTVISAEPLYPGGLPAAIWKFIIVMASDPDGLLSPKQRSNLFDWAKTRDTVERERELSGKLRSLQIWRILEGTECLAYETL